MEITKMNKILKKIFVLITAKILSPFESLAANIWVIINVERMNIINPSKEKNPVVEDIMKNQKVNPAVTANDLKRGEDSSISNRIYEGYQATLCQSSDTY